MITNESSRLNHFQKLNNKNKNSQIVDRPYIAQYKNFQERLNNPKLKSKHNSFILRNRKNNKQNFVEIEELYKSTRSFLLKTSSITQMKQQQKPFQTETDFMPILEEVDLKNKNQEIASKFKDKIWNIKYKTNQSQICSSQNSRVSTIQPLSLRKNATQISNLSLNTDKNYGCKLQQLAYNKLIKQKQNGKFSFMKYKKNKKIVLQKLLPTKIVKVVR